MLEDLSLRISVDSIDAAAALRGVALQVKTAQVETRALGQEISSIRGVQSLERVRASVEGLAMAAADAQFMLGKVALGLSAAGAAAAPLSVAGNQFRVIGGSFRLLAAGAHTTASGFGLLHAFAVNLAAGISFVLLPLRGLIVLGKLAAATLGAALSAVLLPFRALYAAAVLAAKGLAVFLRPVLAIAHGVFQLKLAFTSARLQLLLLGRVLALLPPQLRLVVVGLVALGAAGRAGGLALRVLGAGFRSMQFALLALRNPLAAARQAVVGLSLRLAGLAVSAASAARSLLGMAVSSTVGALRSMAGGVLSLAGNIGGRLLGALASGTKLLAMFAAGAVAFGIVAAAQAETTTVVFGTMLKDMSKGRVLMRELEQWRGAKLFDSKNVQDAGRDLFKAGVPLDALIGRLDQLGNIAVATKTPIEDLSRIYRQGMARGAFQTDLVNQMAERGIDIYHALEAVTGRSGLALSKMLSDGKIGAAEMNAALDHMTGAAGLYGGAIAAVSQTNAGAFSGMVQNMKLAARDVGAAILAAFDFRGVMGSAGDAFASLRGWITGALPALFEFAAVVSWVFKNWSDVAGLAFVNSALGLVQMGADFAHLFTGVLPALFSWFLDNWREIFATAASFVGNVFLNIASNIRAVMSAVWDFIASGGTSSFKVAWTPLLDNFVSTVKELPNIPPRAIGELERSLAEQSADLGEALGGSLAVELDKSLERLAAFQEAQAAAGDLTGGGIGEGGPVDSGGVAEAQRRVENKAATVNSSEGQSAVSQLLSGLKKQDDSKAALTAARDTADNTETIVRELRRAPRIVGSAL